MEKKPPEIKKIACQDGYNWRQCGKRRDKENNYSYYYYRCTYKDCKVKKRLQGTNDRITEIIYDGVPDHPKPHKKSLGDEDKDDLSRWFS